MKKIIYLIFVGILFTSCVMSLPTTEESEEIQVEKTDAEIKKSEAVNTTKVREEERARKKQEERQESKSKDDGGGNDND